MRKDMAKQITECYRSSGPSYREKCRSKNKRTDDDTLPSKEGMRKPYGWDKKQFGENLNPLYRFIGSRVGHKWDDVWKELCEHININNQVQNHILQHVFDRVEINCYEKDGSVYRSDGTSVSERGWPYSWCEYYVAQDGILKKCPSYKAKPKKKDPNIVNHDGKHYYRFNRVWYEVTFAGVSTDMKYDVLTKSSVYIRLETEKTYWGGTRKVWRMVGTPTIQKYDWRYEGSRIAVTKKQLNKKALKVLRKNHILST